MASSLNNGRPDFFMPTQRDKGITDEFNALCAEYKIQCRVSAMPNPGDPFRASRLLHFKSFNNSMIVIRQNNKKKTVTQIPARGECDILLLPEEDYPKFSEVKNYG